MSQKDLANSFFAHLDTASTQSSRAMSTKWSEAMNSNSTMSKNSQQNQGMWQQGPQQFSNHQKTVFCLLSADQKSGANIWKTGKQG